MADAPGSAWAHPARQADARLDADQVHAICMSVLPVVQNVYIACGMGSVLSCPALTGDGQGYCLSRTWDRPAKGASNA